MTGHRRAADDGAVLMYVLALVAVGALLVLPLMTYAVAVLRQNTVLSSKTAQAEALKAGLRVSLADPAALYQSCGQGGPSTPVNLATTRVGKYDVRTQCFYIGFQAAQSSDELRYGLAATEVGFSVPNPLTGSRFVPSPATDPTAWRAATSTTSKTGFVWLPNLPVHALDRRSPAGFPMPAGFPTCTAFFPGTYVDPVVISGPAYFASGVYYFENEVRVQSGASIVVGLGAAEGCTDDQQAAFYAVNAPASHNISGLGGTWVFGGAGRLTVSNSGGSKISLVFNSRYVSDAEAGSDTSAGVSIETVNGGPGAGDLVVAGLLSVPMSLVGADAPVVATTQSYLPSSLTPQPAVPGVPTGVTGAARNGAVLVSWTAPASNGGSPITGYRVTSSTGPTCSTIGATTCAITGLANSTPVTFSVVATNAVGDSPASPASASVTPSGSAATLTAPSTPSAPTAQAYSGSARVSFTAPANGGAPITSYVVTATPGGSQCLLVVSAATTPPLRCDITGLTQGTSYTFSVAAVNAVAPSGASPSSAAVVPSAAFGAIPVTPPATPAAYQPAPVIDINLPDSAEVIVSIPGYVSLPQGRFRLVNPHGSPVVLAGGVLAAQFDISDDRSDDGGSVPIGMTAAIVQRKFRIVSSIVGVTARSTAVVQVNQNGAYAINTWEVQ